MRYVIREYLTPAAIVLACIAVVLFVVGSLGSMTAPARKSPAFYCNGSTGVYTAPNGSQNVQPYDPQCVHVS